MSSHTISYFDLIKIPFVKNKKINRLSFLIYMMIIHMALLFLVYISSSQKAFIRYLVTAIITMLAEIICYFFIYKNKRLYIENYENMFMQLAIVNGEAEASFYSWYFDEHLARMFGYIKVDNMMTIIEKRKELPYWLAQIAFIAIWLSVAICFPHQKDQSVCFYIAHITNSLLYWGVISYVLRIIIVSVYITHDYEKLELSPPISRFNNCGFDSLVRIWNNTIHYFIPFWILFWLYTALVYEHTLVLDSIYVVAALFLVCLWSMTTSMRTLSLARKVRSKAMIRYEKTVIDKHRVFEKSPTQTALYDLQQSIKVFKDYENTVYSEFTRQSYVISIFLNIWVFLLPILYWIFYCL